MLGNNKGIALILVLWVMSALILLAAGIAVMARTEAHISRNYSDIVRCRWAARAGVYSAVEAIKILNQGQITNLGEDPYAVLSDDLSIDLGGYVFEAIIQDESGKVNINTANAEVLTGLFGDSEAADCLMDWRDADDKPSPKGAETDYYSTLKPPYTCKNADFETVREMLLVKGITEETLSAPPSGGTHQLIDLLTVYTQKNQTTSTSSGTTVDIQTATVENLKNAFGEILSTDDINAIITYRTRQAFKSSAEIVLVPGIDRTKTEQIYDRLTVSGTQVTSGRININTAFVEVLSVQAELDQNIAQAIVDYRKENGAFDGVGGLLAIKDVTNEAFVSAAPNLTVRSSIFKIASTGRCTATKASVTITSVVEMGTDGQAQIRYWQE